MRIATWNLEGKWTPRHHWLLRSLRADILLLTEVLDTVAIPGMTIHPTEGEMQPGRRWAAIAAVGTTRPLSDPHEATALAEVDGLLVASSILPWRSSGGALPWVGQDQGSRTSDAVGCIQGAGPIVWGGDWNHELTGRLFAGRSRAGRTSCGLSTTLASTPQRTRLLIAARRPGASTNVAVPAFWTVTAVERVSSIVEGIALSDHDAYVVDID